MKISHDDRPSKVLPGQLCWSNHDAGRPGVKFVAIMIAVMHSRLSHMSPAVPEL